MLITSGKLALDVMEKLLRENGGGRQGGCKLDHRSDKSPLVLLQHRARRGLIRVGLEGEHKDATWLVAPLIPVAEAWARKRCCVYSST